MGLFDAIKKELMEDDGTAATTPTPKPSKKVAASIPNVVPTARPVATPLSVPGLATPSLSTIPMGGQPDEAALKMVEDQVMVANVGGHPSRFLTFLNMWNALGQPNVAANVFAALQVTDKTCTAEAIKSDFDQHLALLDAAVQNASTELDGAEKSLVGEIVDNITDLTKQNSDAEAAIAKMQSDIATRNLEIAAAQNKKAETLNKLAGARQKAALAQETVRGKLTAMSRFFQ